MTEFLYNILKEEKVYSKNDLQSYIENHGPNHQLRLINQSNSTEVFGKLFELENPEISEKEIDISKCIINVDKIYLKGSQNIHFKDCIFLDDVQIGGVDKDIIVIDCCLFFGTLDFASDVINEVNIYASNVPTISIVAGSVGLLDLSRTKIENLIIKEATVKRIRARSNKINDLVVGLSDIGHVEFDHSQIDIKYFRGKNRLKYFFSKYLEGVPKKKNGDLFSFIEPDPKPLFTYFDERTARETINFFEEKTDVRNDKEYLSEIKLNKIIFSQKTLFRKVLVYALGGFVKPTLFILWGMFFYLLFAILYSMPFTEFTVSNRITNLSLYEALYYSGITFTTIGYGDVAPIGVTRYLSVLEGFIGILISSSFLVSLIRKYCD